MVLLPQGGRPSPRSARRRSSSWRASCRHTTTRRRSSRRSGTTTAHSRATRGSSRPAPLNPHPRLAHAYHERFLFLEVCDARQLQRRQARQTHSRRDREPRRSLRQLRHHGDEFSSVYKKNPSLAFHHRRVRTIKMAPRVGFEPTTLRLTAGCSAVELPRNLPISCVLSERAR